MSMKLNLIRAVLAAVAVSLIASMAYGKPKSDRYIRNRIVRIKNERGMCSGEQVRAPSGKDYILSAAHCDGMADKDGIFHIIMEDGTRIDRKRVSVDPLSDLLLIEGIPGIRGLDIAKSIGRFQKLRNFSHGHDYDTYVTQGDVVQDSRIQIMTGIILSEEDLKACSGAPKFKIGYMYNIIPICLLDVTETVTTIPIVPGSSGGADVNDQGELVGVNSASDGEGFGFIVRLSDIQSFLSVR